MPRSIPLDRWEEAVGLSHGLAQEPGRLDVRKRLVKYCLESGRLDEALREIQVLPEEDPERSNLLCRLIEKELAEGHLEEVERHLDRLADEDERKVGFRKDLIKRYLDANDLQKADAAMPLVPRSDKERNRLVTRLMEMYLSSGNLETAAELINRLPAEDPLRLFPEAFDRLYQVPAVGGGSGRAGSSSRDGRSAGLLAANLRLDGKWLSRPSGRSSAFPRRIVKLLHRSAYRGLSQSGDIDRAAGGWPALVGGRNPSPLSTQDHPGLPQRQPPGGRRARHPGPGPR